MSTFLRIIVLSLFAAVGIGAAVSVALHLKPDALPVAALAPDSSPATENPEQRANADTPLAAEPSLLSSDVSNHAALPPTAPAIIAPYHGPVAQDIQRLEETVREIREDQRARFQSDRSLLDKALDLVNERNKAAAKAEAAPQPVFGKLRDDADSPPTPQDAEPLPTPDREPIPSNAANNATNAPPQLSIQRGEGDDSLDISLRDADIRATLELLGKQGGLNILSSRSVQGLQITATLNHVDVQSALKAILKTAGLIARYEGAFIYVGTPEDLQSIDTAADKINTRVYYPNYVKASELQTLITPLLSPTVGKISVTTAAEVGIANDNSSAGGDAYTGNEVLLVRDYEQILWQIDQVVSDVDKRPRQVAIEAMILSVRLNDTNRIGVDFQLLRDKNNVRLFTDSPAATLASVTPNGGLKFGLLDSTLGAFLDALENIGDTNVIASPRLTCLNKQKAEILIGSKLGYVSTTVTQTFSTQTVQFLEVGTQLRIRPFISSDGTIRLEVHPEVSSGTVRVAGGFTLPDKDVTEVTTNIQCYDGGTVIIGGLIREELSTTANQIPYLGNLPYLGVLFRRKVETTDRRELIVLLTPRIVDDEVMHQESKESGGEFMSRHNYYRDKMSPIGKRHYGERYLRLARSAWAAEDAWTAFRYVNLSLQFHPMNLDATALRDEIVGVHPEFDASITRRLRMGTSPPLRPHKDYSKSGHPWQPPHSLAVELPDHNNQHDLGQPGPVRHIEAPLPPDQDPRPRK